MTRRCNLILEDFRTVLSRISVDEFSFLVTAHPLHAGGAILWCNPRAGRGTYEALGQFSAFDKRKVLDFVARYTTSRELRQLLEHKRFEAKVEHLSPSTVADLGRLAPNQRRGAYRDLFNLDTLLDGIPLSAKRRIMARRFHPDAGGDGRVMQIINEAYDYLAANG